MRRLRLLRLRLLRLRLLRLRLLRRLVVVRLVGHVLLLLQALPLVSLSPPPPLTHHDLTPQFSLCPPSLLKAYVWEMIMVICVLTIMMMWVHRPLMICVLTIL